MVFSGDLAYDRHHCSTLALLIDPVAGRLGLR